MNPLSKYKYQSDIEHVLNNPGMWVGSTQPAVQDVWIMREDRCSFEAIEWTPALYQLVDEPLTNCHDHIIRCRKTPCPVTRVDCIIDGNRISISNDGEGIDVEKHPQTQLFIPEMVFAHLRTSTNYSNPGKIVGGKHGLGVKLTCIFSRAFTIEVVDEKRSLKYTQLVEKNMSLIHPPKIRALANKPDKGTTRLTFELDLARLGIGGDTPSMPEYLAWIVRKRIHDLAFLAPEVKFRLNGKVISKQSLKGYMESCVGNRRIAVAEQEGWKVAMAHREDFMQMSFVNGICTIQGGCHVEHVLGRVIAPLRKLFKDRKNLEIPAAFIRSQLFCFIAATVIDPDFAGQTKSALLNKSFLRPFEPSADFIDKLYKYISAPIISLHSIKEKVKKERVERKLLSETDGLKTRTVRGVPELTDANLAGSTRSEECILIVCEGESAATSILSGLSSSARNLYGVYPIRGKLLNPQDKGAAKLAGNKVLTDLKKVLGLESGHVYKSARALRYGRVVFMTDQDLDGHHIKALGLNMFHALWPSLLQVPNFLGFIQTPLVKIKGTGAGEIIFYHEQEFREWRKKNSLGSRALSYYKGLGTSTSEEFRGYLKQPRVIHFAYTATTPKIFRMAFSKDEADARKKWLYAYNREAAMKIEGDKVTYDSFINDELIHFSKYDCDRSIPAIDGLKISQRKILFIALGMGNGAAPAKVAQFCGLVAGKTHYHHGETVLEKTAVGMAQDFVGANNINLLEPNGQFGSRRMGGDDASASRYIYTRVRPIARLIYRAEDDPILEYAEEDGERVEPRHYLPIIPMILVNGAIGIGTGFSCTVLAHEPRDIVSYLLAKLEGKVSKHPTPHYRGFTGAQVYNQGKFTTRGRFEYKPETRCLSIRELPIGVWTIPYKKHLEDLAERGAVVTYKDCCTDREINLDVQLANYGEGIHPPEEQIIKTFHLEKSQTENMYLFDYADKLRKFASVEDIVDYYIPVRLAAYERRKAHLLTEIDRNLAVARSKSKYILLIIKGELVVTVARSKLIGELEARDFERQGGSFDYLLKMSIDSLCSDMYDKLERESARLVNERANLESKTAKSIWRAELKELESALK